MVRLRQDGLRHDVVVAAARIPRYSVEQAFSKEGAVRSRIDRPPTRPKTPPSITSRDSMRGDSSALQPICGLSSTLSERKPRGHGRVVALPQQAAHAAVPLVQPGEPLSPPRKISRDASPFSLHHTQKMLAAYEAPNDASVGGGLLGRSVPSLSPTAARPLNPLDLPMLWPQPPPALMGGIPSGVPTLTSGVASGVAPPPPLLDRLDGGGIAGSSAVDGPLSPSVRSYVTFGGGRFSSRQIAALSRVRAREVSLLEAAASARAVADASTSEGAAPVDAAAVLSAAGGGEAGSKAGGEAGDCAEGEQSPGSQLGASSRGACSSRQGPWLLEDTPYTAAASHLDAAGGFASDMRGYGGLRGSPAARRPADGPPPPTPNIAPITGSACEVKPATSYRSRALPSAERALVTTSQRLRSVHPPRPSGALGASMRQSDVASAEAQAWWLMDKRPSRGYGAARSQSAASKSAHLMPLRGTVGSRPSTGFGFDY